MQTFKYFLLSLVTLFVLVLLGYWAFATIQSGTEHAKEEKIKQLEEKNQELSLEVKKLTDENSALESQVAELAPIVEKNQENPKEDMEQIVSYKHQTLINELQKLITENIFLKLKSNGAKVGTAQKFLNIYNNTTNKVDNDYGEGTKKAVAEFQKAVGLTADGEAGPGTFKKMVEWLKTQG